MADYSSIDSKIDSTSLGNYSTYEQSNKRTIDVTFQPDLSTGYYSVISMNTMGGNGIGYDLSNELSNDLSNNNYDISGQEQEKPLYSIGSSPINGFFIGSVTVLGLFLLYRLLKK